MGVEDLRPTIKNKDGIIKGGYLFKDNSNDKININLYLLSFVKKT